MQTTTTSRRTQTRMPELEPWLQTLVDRATHEIELAIEKVTAHFVHGAAYPMPRDRRAPEKLFLVHVRSLAQANKNKAAETIAARLKQTPAARKRALGALAALDLKTRDPGRRSGTFHRATTLGADDSGCVR